MSRKYNLNVPDSIVAATSTGVGGKVVTNDTDFERIEEVEVIEL